MPRLKHGDAPKSGVTPEYRLWVNMRYRCRNPKSRNYKYYGARGIGVCNRWQESFDDFLADVGRRPSPSHSLDRIDSNRGYEPGNVRWATDREQMNNRRDNRLLTWSGQTFSLAEWARQIGVLEVTLRARLRKGWPIEQVLSPVRVEYSHPKTKGD